jgi:GST-like protein
MSSNDSDTANNGASPTSTTATTTPAPYAPPKVWTWQAKDDNKFASINQPTAGARDERKLPVGKHALQLYSLATPNGQKVTIMLEELLAAGYAADYDAWLVKIGEADQFGSDFVAINPNSKIPALMDYNNSSSSSSKDDTKSPVRLFESGSMLLYLAEKFDHAFLPAHNRTEVLNWLFWQMGSAPYVGGGFGHFYHYANEKQEYPIDRFTMETKRQLDVLNQRLEHHTYIAGEEYTIADMAIWPWYGAALVLGGAYGQARTFLAIHEYTHLVRWSKRIAERSAVQRGRLVNRVWGEDGPQLAERHSAADIDQAMADFRSKQEAVAAVGVATNDK